MKGIASRLLCAAVVLLAAAFAGSSSAAYGEGADATASYRIVALGDSLAYGYQPGMTETTVPYGYADRLYEQALFHGRAKLDNYGILGLRTDGLLTLLQGARDGKTLKAADIQDFSGFSDSTLLTVLAGKRGAQTAEIRSNLAAANLVVFTIGGNDFTSFLQSLLKVSKDDAAAALEGDFLTKVNNYTFSLEQSLRLTAQLAPNAQLLVTDQYLPMPEFLNKELYPLLYDKAVGPLTGAVDALAAKLRAEGLNVGAVHVAERFKGKEGAMTWMKPLSGTTDIHPTPEGYEAIASAFSESVWQEYRKPAARPADVPISVIVTGKELTTANKPVVKPPGVTFLALRDISDAMGAELSWDDKSKTAVFRQNGREVSITIGAKEMTVNGQAVTLIAPAYLQAVGKESKTYVPISVIASGLGYEVIYSGNLHTAFINR